jgi:hypothetical protein
VALGLLQVRRRRVVPHHLPAVRRPSGRAPPGPLTHH